MNLVAIQNLLGHVHPILAKLSGIPLAVFLLVVAMTAAFVLGFIIQGTRVGLQLWIAVRRIRKLKKSRKPVKPEDVGNVLRREPFNHLWNEYADTLHKLKMAGVFAD